MKILGFIILTPIILTACQTTAHIAGVDKDWNVEFYSNCALSTNTIKTVKENENKFLRFQLKEFQIGGCSSDRKPRHSAPYWERAELKQRGFLDANSTYEINFKVRFLEGFKGSRETFFQIHQSVPSCRTGPTTMLKFHFKRLRLDAKRNLIHHSKYYSDINLEKIKNKWSEFKFIYNGGKKIINVYLNNQIIFKEIPFMPMHCGQPHIKIGIYRPGNKYEPIETSVIDFDEIKVNKIE